jgi:hypothetical protein
LEPQGPWFKFYHEWSHDPKIQTLSEADQRRHVVFMALHCRGEDFDLTKYAYAMRISTDELSATIARLSQAGVRFDDRGNLSGWKKRQGPSEKERQRKSRQKRKAKTEESRDSHVTVTVPYRDCHTPDADADPEAERQEKNPPPPTGSGPQPAGQTAPVRVGPCPYQAIVDAYHDILPELPRVRVQGEKLRKEMHARWAEDKKRQDVEWWKGLFDLVKRSDFLMGRKTDWHANLGWIVTRSKFENVMNGLYDDKTRDVIKRVPTLKENYEASQRESAAMLAANEGKHEQP